MLFVISHQPNPRFIKQINYFAQNGYRVSVIYFYRDSLANLDDTIDENVTLYMLDKIENGKYLKRLFVYFRSFFRLKKLLVKIKLDKIIITNIDILLLLILNNIKKYTKNIIMEISDLRAYTFNSNLLAKIQQYIDDILLNRYLTKMIFTSPKFNEYYYGAKFNGDIFILENKPLESMMPTKIDKCENNKIVIGIVGLLLDGKPHTALFDYAKNREDIEVHIYGKGSYEEQAKEYSQNYENIKYFGEYNFFKDVAAIYASLDIIYMSYDTSSNDLNINLALPNKLYEAMYYKVPIITSKGTYLAQRVEENEIGYTINCCDEKDIENSIKDYIINKDKLLLRFDTISKDEYTADDDYNKLLHFI